MPGKSRCLNANDVYVFARQHLNETVIIAINRAAQEKEIAVPAGAIGLRDNSQAVGTIGSNRNSDFCQWNRDFDSAIHLN